MSSIVGNPNSEHFCESDGNEVDEGFRFENLEDISEGFGNALCQSETEEWGEDEVEVEHDSGVNEDGIAIDGLVDIAKIDLRTMSAVDVIRCHFPDCDTAFMFYNWFGRLRGFSARRDKVLKTKKGEVVQQTFVCYRQGYRPGYKVDEEVDKAKFGNKKRSPKKLTRCRCEARFRVHVNNCTGRWHVTLFINEHSHELLDPKACGLLAGHRKMNEADVIQMNNYLNAGISTPQLYAFLNQCGGQDNMNFILKDVYNQIGRQRKSMVSDAKAAIAFLKELQKKDPLMFWRYRTDDEGRLQHLFWCDGTSILNYNIFGDVLAFDATYCKNKYMCPIVFFSGVNHHNQTSIFAIAFVGNETEETYVWLLQQFLEAMNGKVSVSVIIDGDVAMRNAIKQIFPKARHRLCAWHLLRNATSNVLIPNFTSDLTDLMLGDYEVMKFNKKWQKMIEVHRLEENTWVKDLFDKRHMWATAYLRGNFFAGFRTTLRCEGFHSMIGKFVDKRKSLTQFMHSFQRCLDRMRFNEEETDFASVHGEAMLTTHYVALEQSASWIFTKEMFKRFRIKLERCRSVRVIGFRQTCSSCIYTLSKYRRNSSIWRVTVNEDTQDVKCSCLQMESVGLPCEHILCVLVYLDYGELPKCLVLDRWTKNARKGIEGQAMTTCGSWDGTLMARYVALNERSKEMNLAGCLTLENFYSTLDLITDHTKSMKLVDDVNVTPNDDENPLNACVEDEILDPVRIRTKGCPTGISELEFSSMVACRH